MTRQSTKHSGGKTTAAQQRINQALSVASLSRLLQLNFAQGAYLIELSYDPDHYVPVAAYVEQDVSAWLRVARRQLNEFQYVRAIEWARDDRPNTVHHVIMDLPKEDAECVMANWTLGPTRIKEIAGGQVPALAERLVANAGTETGRRAWTASRGLKRS